MNTTQPHRWGKHKVRRVLIVAALLAVVMLVATTALAASLTQVSKLTASDGAEGDSFGYSVAVSGTTVIVGALNDDDAGDYSGSAYVFDLASCPAAPAACNEVSKLTTSDAAEDDQFGISVALAGNGTTAVIGARGDDATGSAYVFMNQPPVADAGGPYSVPEGDSVSLDASGSSDPEQATATLTFEWDFNEDGVYDDATGIDPSFSAAGLDGPYSVTVGLRVTDAFGLTDTDTAMVNVTNLDPTITAVENDGPIVEGLSATVTVSATDPAGASDPLEYAFDCDNDTIFEVGPQAGNATSCSFDGHGEFTVNVRVTDDDGGLATGSTSVTVQTAREAIDDVIPAIDDLIEESTLNGGQGNALITKLEAAIAKLDQGNETAAINQLNALLNQIDAFVDEGILTPAEAQPLIDAINEVLDALSS